MNHYGGIESQGGDAHSYSVYNVADTPATPAEVDARAASYSSTVDILDTRTMELSVAALSYPRQYFAVAAAGGKAFFAGGFGNAGGTGAHFLMADGSVKFFPNSTSRDVLIRLSTRNGDDPVTVPE